MVTLKSVVHQQNMLASNNIEDFCVSLLILFDQIREVQGQKIKINAPILYKVK